MHYFTFLFLLFVLIELAVAEDEIGFEEGHRQEPLTGFAALIQTKRLSSHGMPLFVGDDQDPGPGSSSALNEIVGEDGVLVITLERTPERFEYTSEALSMVGIKATPFYATDSTQATAEELALGCIHTSDPKLKKVPNCRREDWDRGYNWGCRTVWQAIADSHRRALNVALQRNATWTAILEDDMALVQPDHWNERFRAAWASIPPEIKIVRLSWCMAVPQEEEVLTPFNDTGDFVLYKWVGLNRSKYSPGLCTGGYMVHQDIIPEMLSWFPCCGSLDGCYKEKFEEKYDGKEFRGIEVMISMAARESRTWIDNATGCGDQCWMGQHGVLYMDTGSLASTRISQQKAETKAQH